MERKVKQTTSVVGGGEDGKREGVAGNPRKEENKIRESGRQGREQLDQTIGKWTGKVRKEQNWEMKRGSGIGGKRGYNNTCFISQTQVLTTFLGPKPSIKGSQVKLFRHLFPLASVINHYASTISVQYLEKIGAKPTQFFTGTLFGFRTAGIGIQNFIKKVIKQWPVHVFKNKLKMKNITYPRALLIWSPWTEVNRPLLNSYTLLRLLYAKLQIPHLWLCRESHKCLEHV